jgi:hypothetical protein
MMNPDTQRLDQELHKLRNNGLVLPTHPFRAAQAYKAMADTDGEMRATASRDINGLSASLGRKITAANYDSPEVQRIMGHNTAMTNAMGAGRGLGNRTAQSRQRANQQDQRWNTGFSPKTSMIGGGQGSPMGGDVMNAIPRFYDPLEYWDLSGLPWNVADEGHRHKLHKWLRLYYATHYLVPVLVDIFTRFPLVGMELECKDPKLVEIYNDIFLDQLHYEDFLVNLGREFWLVGEAFPLGSFDEDLGIWEHEELINPEDVVIDNFPLLGTQQLKIVPPDYLRRIAQTRSPAREWYMLQEQYEELIPYLLKGEHIPISPVMLTQVANKLNDWDDHGTPILLRGLRTLLHEEKLLASQDAIAERLYSPFILAKLGIMDMGDGLPPWVPTPDELQSVRDDIDIAMASDFRVMVHHFGLEMSSVFGREQMPRLGDDFDRIERRLMQVFGVNPSLLSAGSNSQPYASSALQAEFMNQMLRTFQKTLKEHFRNRALVVAEAQGHYDYERKGQTRVPIYETVVKWDDEGNKQISREKKLLIPELNFATFDLRDEATERQFIMGLRQAGLPIPDEKLMIGVTWKNDDYIDEYNRSIQRKTISQQQAKMDTYIALVIKGLPVPMDLKYEVESVLQGGTGPEGAPAPPGGDPSGAGGDPAGGGGGAPPGGAGGAPPEGGKPPGGTVMPPPPPGLAPGGSPPPTQPGGAGAPSPGGSVPQVSNERRQGLTYNTSLQHLEPINNKYDLGETIKDWPEDVQHRARAIYDAVQLGGEYVMGAVDVKEAATIDDSSETDDPATWEVKSNQKIAEQDGENVIVARTKRVIVPISAEKKYSIIDPSISYDTEFTEPEQPGPRTASDTGDEPDPVGAV